MRQSLADSVPLAADERRYVRPTSLRMLDDLERPRTRGDCANSPRPCPWCSCKYHLAVDVTPSGTLILNFPTIDVSEMAESCALDVAERGGMAQGEAAALVGLKKGRAGQIERKFVRMVAR